MRFLCLLFLILFSTISAQTEIKGYVLTESGLPVSGANIILLDQQNHIETFVFTQKDGSFSFNTNKHGTLMIKVTALEFLSKVLDISINKSNSTINLKTIFLNNDRVKEIKEVIVSKSSPIKIKQDTIEFKAINFSNGTELNVEELLKKLPGLTIQSDGKIKFGNKEVDRVMVENDDLFERGYQTLTQNMPSTPVEKIQILKNYSKNKLLKGIENNESVAINLTLKEDAKSKWFGNAVLVSTSYKENMYQAKFNLMNFSKKKKVYFLFNTNNLGLNEMKGIEYLVNPESQNYIENVGGNINTLSIVNLHQKNAQFDDKRTNFNKDKLVSLNYIHNFKNNWKLKFVTIFNPTENRNYINSTYKFNYDGITFNNFEDKIWKQNNKNIVGKIEVVKDLGTNSSLQFYNKVSSLNENNYNSFLFNGQTNSQIGTNTLISNENRIIYTKKIDSTKAFVAVAKYMLQDHSYNFTDENDIFQYITGNPEAKKANQIIKSNMNFGGIKTSYIKKYTKENTLELQLGNEYRKDFLNSDLSLYNQNNQNIKFSKSNFVNHLNYSQNNFFFQAKYMKKKNKWNYGVIFLNQYTSSNLNDDKNSKFLISPNITVGYENKKTGNITLFGGRKFSTISINDVYTNYIYQGNRSFKQSDLGFNILPDYNIGLTYTFGDILSEYLTFNLNYTRNEDYISTNMIVNPNYTFNQNILVKNNNAISSNLEIKKYLKFIRSRISLLGTFISSDYENSVNNQRLIKSKFSSLKTGFEMKSGWTTFINYELGYQWIFNKIMSDVNDNKYIDQKGFINLYMTITPEFRIESYLEYYKFGNTNARTTQFWDVKLNYRLKKQNMNLFLHGNNLLNSNSIQRFSISNISESLYTQKLIPLHIVLGLNKSF